MPWVSLLAFVRLVTNPRVFESTEPVDRAWEQVTDWVGSPVSWIPLPTEDHAEVLGRMLTTSGVVADLVPDAHLAALAVEHGFKLCFADTDVASSRTRI